MPATHPGLSTANVKLEEQESSYDLRWRSCGSRLKCQTELLRACQTMADLRKNREKTANYVIRSVLRICDSCFVRSWHFYSLWESTGYRVESQNDQLRLIWNLIWARLEAVIIPEQETIAIHENQSIRGDSKMKSGQIYLWAAVSWVRQRAQSPHTISNGSLTGNKTPLWQQLRSLIGPGHVIAGNPSSSRKAIAIVRLGTWIAILAICD